jgi:cytochrome c biogenesis protein CcdA
VDGLNPCAFATLVFFVSYLALSGRKGREILAVGAAFTLGVFLAYLAVGLGFYEVLGMLGHLLTRLGRWVYGLTAVLCAGLAVVSLLDYLKARRGDIGDMSLNLPHSLRMRINAVIRRGRGAQAYMVGAFVTGLIVSFLELACTGQVYLPTIIFVTSVPELRVRAVLYLVLYNLLFILPLIVVFILAYYGTTSKDLTRFMQRNAATVKLGMVLLFAFLAAWLGLSLI